MYSVTKTYGHDLGLSATFRQWRATSHCRFIHGYALAVTLHFEAETLDARNWVIDFGSLKPIKAWLVEMFDHKMLVAKDDPQLERLVALSRKISEGYGCEPVECPPVADILVVDAVGCEAFARMIFDYVKAQLRAWQEQEVAPLSRGVRIARVEVREHGANAGGYGEQANV